ncbi:MAG: glycosyltransferase family 4 protein [Patescibacteria group bacterium]
MTPRVLMLGWELPPYNSGGLGTACEGLALALADEEVETIFVLPKKLPITSDVFKIIFAGPAALVGDEKIIFAAYKTGTGVSEKFAGLSLLDEVKLYARRVRKLVKQESGNFDVIHAHDWLAFPAGLVAREVSGKPLVVHVHATEFDRGGGTVNQQVYEIEKRGMALADQIIAVSDWTKKLLVKHYGIASEKIKVVHNGVRAEEYTVLPGTLEALKKSGNKIVLFVGRITLQKGPDYFVQLAKRVLEYAPQTYFVMVGTGDMLPQVMKLAAELRISDRFFFPGFLRGAELAQVYQAADLYILPSVSEPFGITPLESLANGTPVLVSKQSGVAEVLSHALKVDFWDVDEMTNQILAVLKHDSLQKTLADYGREEVKGVTWAKAAEKCLAVYKQVCYT